MENKMLRVETDPTADAVYIQLLDGPIGYSEELDDNRLIDRSLNPGKPVGVDLLSVSEGVKLDGLPEPETIKRILVGLGIKVY
ncbi:MAG: DUF2283 domain-containing protein [Dehalococcoidia bacterium]|nr:DUF2283 domain-containing protein [Dehalococcoidia bacterium]